MAIENLTTYTEVDENSDLSISPLAVTFDTIQANAETYVYKDYGAGYFGNFDIDFEIEITSIDASGLLIFCAITNTIGTYATQDIANDSLQVYVHGGSGSLDIWMVDRSTNNNDTYSFGGSSLTKKYCTFIRSDTTLTLDIYSDSGRTSLVDSLSLVVETETKRYMHVLASQGSGGGVDETTGVYENYEIQFNSSSSSSTSVSSSSSSTSYEPYENLKTYTEVDENSDLTVDAIRVAFDTIQQDANTYLYKDFGVAYFGNFKFEFSAAISGASGTTPDVAHCAVSNTLGATDTWVGASDGIMIDTYWDGQLKTRIVDLNGGITQDNYIWPGSSFVKHYFTFERSESIATLNIYSDSNRTSLVDTLSISSVDTGTKRYFYALGNTNSGSSNTITGFSENYEIQFNSSSSSSVSSSSSSTSSSSTSSSSSSTNSNIWANSFSLEISGVTNPVALSAFPVLINLTSASGITGYDATNIFTELGSSYQKLKIEDQNNTSLFVEVEDWDNGNNKAALWTSIPTIPTGGTTLLLYYDSTQINNPRVGTPGTSAGEQVWDSNYVSVMHLSQSAAGGADSMIDSTSNSFDGTPNNMDAGNLVDGEYGTKAQVFNGSDETIYGDNNAAYNVSSVTVELYLTRTSSITVHNCATQYGKSSGQSWGLNVDLALTGSGDNIMEFAFYNGAWQNAADTSTFDQDTYYYFAGIHDGAGNAAIFRNGTATASAGSLGALDYTSPIGYRIATYMNGASPVAQWPGHISEARVSNIQRSDNWILATNASLTDSMITFAEGSSSSSSSSTSVSSSSSSSSSSISSSSSSSSSSVSSSSSSSSTSSSSESIGRARARRLYYDVECVEYADLKEFLDFLEDQFIYSSSSASLSSTSSSSESISSSSESSSSQSSSSSSESSVSSSSSSTSSSSSSISSSESSSSSSSSLSSSSSSSLSSSSYSCFITPNDDFTQADGTEPDVQRWEKAGAETMIISGGALRGTVDFTNNYDAIISRFSLEDAFDAQVDYNIVSGADTGTNGWNLGMKVVTFDDEIGLDIVNRGYQTTYTEYVISAGVRTTSTNIATTNTSGSIRITRDSSQNWQSYYWNGAWVSIGPITSLIDADPWAELYLYVENYSLFPGAIVDFDNFTVTGAINCPNSSSSSSVSSSSSSSESSSSTSFSSSSTSLSSSSSSSSESLIFSSSSSTSFSSSSTSFSSSSSSESFGNMMAINDGGDTLLTSPSASLLIK